MCVLVQLSIKVLYFLQTCFRGYFNKILSCIYISNNTFPHFFEYTQTHTKTHSHCYILNLWKICISGVCSGNMMIPFLLMTSWNSSMLRRSSLCENKSHEALIFILIYVREVWIQQSYMFNFIIGFNSYWIVWCLCIYCFFSFKNVLIQCFL